MDASSIHSRETFDEWLRKKPAGWGPIISARAALRALPHLVSAGYDWNFQHSLPLVRAAVMMWASYSSKSLEIFQGLKDASVGTPASKQVSRSAYNASTAIAVTVNAIHDYNRSRTLSAYAVTNAVAALEKRHRGAHQAQSWKSIQADCNWLVINSNKNAEDPDTELLMLQPLWLGGPNGASADVWRAFRGLLAKMGGSQSVWAEWYERRVRGDETSFDIPGDKSRLENRKILNRLAEATDKDFWDKGHRYVNATLKGWLDEARAGVVSPKEAGNEEPALPVQNRNALSFRRDENGRITIDSAALADQLRIDSAAQGRHAEAVSEAQIWLDRCRGNNAAARLTRFLENYLEAAGENVEAVKPSLLVQRGERLRQELARYDAPDHMLPPVADDLLLDGKGWQSAHNMLVGLDPVLMASDTAMLGPDRQPTLIAPNEIREKTHEADEAGILAEGVVEIIDETVDLAPIVPDPDDRRTIFSTEMVQNLFIEAFAIALNQPGTACAVVAIGAVLSSGPVAGVVGSISMMGTIKAAEYLVTHRQWILSRFGNTPTWQALITKLADWLEKVTPFKPK
jgi:hypothetical protein